MFCTDGALITMMTIRNLTPIIQSTLRTAYKLRNSNASATVDKCDITLTCDARSSYAVAYTDEYSAWGWWSFSSKR